jgi:hypothetical protein
MYLTRSFKTLFMIHYLQLELVHFSFSVQHEFIPLCFKFPTMEEVNNSYVMGP